MLARSACVVLSCCALSACASAPEEQPAPPSAVVVLAPDLAEAGAAGRSEEDLRAELEQALVARAQASPLVRAARAADRGERIELELDLARAVGEVELAELTDHVATSDSFEIAIVAQDEDRIDLADEKQRLETWRDAHPDARLSGFARVERADGGPHPDVRWAASWPSRPSGPLPLLVQNNPAWVFGSRDVAQAYPSLDPAGFPAVGFELVDARRQDFGDFTEANVDRLMAVVTDGVVTSVARINDRLPGSCVIMGRFSKAEAASLMRELSAPALLPAPVSVIEVRKNW